jgi:glyoxylase-like metal-dependent hydrolase (beta-lactamase superfamily II)
MKLGDIEVIPVLDGYGLCYPTELFFRTTSVDWEPHRQYLRPDGRWEYPVGAYVVFVDDRVVLVDAGLGPRKFANMVGGRLLDSLAASGVAQQDITDLVLTHLHWDHFGWVWHHGQRTFPNATYYCHVQDWKHFTEGKGARWLAEGSITAADGVAQEEGSWLDVLRTIEDRLETWNGDRLLFSGVDLVAAPGHTPGNSMVILSSGTERALIVGDVMHCPAQMTETEWEVLGDFDAVAASKARVQLLREVEGTDTKISAPHFPGMEFGRVVVGEGKRQWAVSSARR